MEGKWGNKKAGKLGINYPQFLEKKEIELISGRRFRMFSAMVGISARFQNNMRLTQKQMR